MSTIPRKVATILALAAASAVLPQLATPAAAVGVFVGATWTTPVTWVDDAGRQYVTVTSAAANGDGWPVLRIARDLPDGTPDAAWGPDGVASVAFEPPAAGLAMITNVAAADDGTLSVAWSESGCTGDECWSWFSRHDGATGARAGTAVDRGAGVGLTRQLDDGTWLGTDGGTLVRVDGAGALLGAPAIDADVVVGTDPTASGDLLTVDLAGTLRRTPAGGGPDDLTLATGCAPADTGIAVGAAPDGGFAVACRPAGGGPLTVTSYDAAGTPEWTTPKTSPEIGLSAADRATVDGDGRVWVAGRGVGTDHGTSLPVATLGSFTEVGDEIVHYARSTGTSYTTGIDLSVTGIRDLRTVGDDHVAFADLKVCCRYHNNTSMYLSVYGQVFPKAPAPPDCTLEQPAIEATGASGLLLTFEQCNHREIERRPTGYRVGRRGAGTIEVVHTEGRPSHTIDMAGMGHARLVVVEVTPFNDQGDTVGPIATASTVLPFDSVGSFHIRQVVDLAGSDAIPGGTVDAIEAGEVTPAEVMEDLIEGHGAERTVAPLARIYRAYFLRDADPSGLDYWIGRRRAGWTIQRISEHFSRSSEFVRTYGALSDREFVELIYQNVLGRPSDPGGADYWSRKLARGTPRGTVMAQFSESSEFIRTSAPLVQPLVVSKLMLDRPPTADERDRWALEADPYATIPSEILGTDEYRARIAD